MGRLIRSNGFEAPRSSRIVDRRPRLPFRSVNRIGQPGYQPGMQRHHLLPRQLLSQQCFGRLFDAVGLEYLAIDDFRRNGLLLPANDPAALRTRLPLHRGPHRSYNGMVVDRVGQIEGDWARLRQQAPEIAIDQALMRLDLLQRALRRGLLRPDGTRLKLNRGDPLGAGADFTALDAMADTLWGETSEILPADAG